MTAPHPWPLHEAKARLSELIRKAQEQGPQHISLHGNPAVVVISEKEYRSLTTPTLSLVTFLRHSPLVGTGLDFQRDTSPNRDTDL